MKRGYKYEKEIHHWLDGGEIEKRFGNGGWHPFDGMWIDNDEWQYRIAEKQKEERWLYVYSTPNGVLVNTDGQYLIGCNPVGKIRMEDV